MESAAHLALKHAAVCALAQSGCAGYATEIRCPIGRFRLDAAGYIDARPKSQRHARKAGVARGHEHDSTPPQVSMLERGSTPRSVIVEVKVSRSDFFCDAVRAQTLEQACRDLSALRADALAAVPASRHANGPACEMLFAELEPWESAGAHLSCQRILDRAFVRTSNKLGTSTKLALLAQYQLASHLLLLTPPGLLTPGEVPQGWGLMECDWQSSAAPLRLVTRPPLLATAERYVLRMLRNIAAAASRQLLVRERALARHASAMPALPHAD